MHVKRLSAYALFGLNVFLAPTPVSSAVADTSVQWSSDDCPSLAAGREGAKPTQTARAAPVIGSISLEGLRHTRPEVVQRQLRHREGGSFNCSDWQAERNRLADLDVFADIEVAVGWIKAYPSQTDSAYRPEPDSTSPGRLVVTYRFRELPPYVPYVSLAKTDQDGFSAGPAVVALNLFGTANHFELASRFGGTTEIYSSLSGLELGQWPVEYDVLLSHVDSYNDPLDFHEDSWRFKTDLKQPWQSSHWLAVGGYEFMSLRSDKPGITVSDRANTFDRLHRVALGLAYDQRNRRRLPNNGFYFEARVQQTGQSLSAFWGGLGNYAGASREYLLDIRKYWPITARQNLAFTLLQRYREGDIPRYDLYRAGGANSLRGFAHGATLSRNESVCFFEDRLTLFPRRTLKAWNWGIPLAMQGVMGVEWMRSWSHGTLFDADDLVSVYIGVHVLTGGLDRVRFEGGSNITTHHTATQGPGFAPHADIGFFDKADAQRFRTR